MGRYIAGQVDDEVTLGTLGSNTAVLDLMSETVNERTYVSSVDVIHALHGLTPAAGDGPILVGFAHGNYQLAELEEWIEQTQSWNEGDVVGTREIGRRLIKRVGIFPSAVGDGNGNAVLNDGKPIKTKLGWILTQGQTIAFWAYNTGGSSLATTSPVYHVQGIAHLWPR